MPDTDIDEVNMIITEANIGFPSVDGYLLQPHVECSSPHTVRLWFYRQNPDLSSILNVHVFLFNARMLHADVELNPFFPAVTSCIVEHNNSKKQQPSVLDIQFVRGEMSFSFQKAFHVNTVQPLGHVPDELRNLAEDH